MTVPCYLDVHALVATAQQATPADLILSRPGRGHPRPPRPLLRTIQAPLDDTVLAGRADHADPAGPPVPPSIRITSRKGTTL